MRLSDSNDKITVEYDHQKIKELLIKYTEVLGDVGKAFDQLSQDLLTRAKNEMGR